MLIKKYIGESETEAIMKAKEELGKDAIVMNIKALKPKGIYKLFKKPSVEVTAAIDEEEEKNPGAQLLSKMEEVIQDKKADDLEEKEETIVAEQEKHKEKMILSEEDNHKEEDKLENLQKMLEMQMQANLEKEKEQSLDGAEKEMKNQSKAEACVELIYNQLLSNEVEEVYAKSIIEDIQKTLNKDTSVDNILATIYQKIILKLGQAKTISMEESQPKYIFFIGPTGVGKTTTIAKIASELKLRKKAKVAVITSDTYRIAAVEQLRTYTNILGIPLKVIYSEKEMQEAKLELNGYDIILIDTAGRSHQSKEQTEDIERLIQSIPEQDREIYLVLSTTTKYKDLVKITEVYSKITKYSLIFTKLDETCCIGNILNVRMLTDASLSYVTSGQNVPDDIEMIDAQKIAKQLLGGQ